MTEVDRLPLAYQSNQAPRPPTPDCPKCQSRMTQGVAFAGGAGSTTRGRTFWVAGQVRRGWLGRIVMPKGKWFEVVAFRCPTCGFVESYCPPG